MNMDIVVQGEEGKEEQTPTKLVPHVRERAEPQRFLSAPVVAFVAGQEGVVRLEWSK